MTNKTLQRKFAALDRHMTKAQKDGLAFEHKVKSDLQEKGWHVMRRTFSWGVVFCGFCGKHTSRQTMKCSKCGSAKQVLKASLDLTAYKDGVYLMITCKYSSYKGTSFIVDETWENLVAYANIYNALPTFAGIDSNRHIHYTNLLTLKRFSENFFNQPSLNLVAELKSQKAFKYKPVVTRTKIDSETAKNLEKEAWDTIDFANKIMADTDASNSDRSKAGAVKVQMIDKIIKLHTSGALQGQTDDLANMMSRAEEILKKEKEKENAV